MPRHAEEKREYQDFLNFTLRDFLALRGLKQTGKKVELEICSNCIGTLKLTNFAFFWGDGLLRKSLSVKNTEG